MTTTAERVAEWTDGEPEAAAVQAHQLVQAGLTRRQRWAARRRWRRWLARLGWYELVTDPILTSTRQAEALSPFLVSTRPAVAGPFSGISNHTGQPVCIDQHALYTGTPRRISSVNVTVAGAVGSTKSSLVKTMYVLRKVAIGGQLGVFDRKDQQGRGEYIKTALAGKGTVLHFDRVGGCRVNVLDPALSVTSHTDASGAHVVGQDDLLTMVATHAHGPLTSKERTALRAAHRGALAAAMEQGRVAILSDVVEALYRPGADAVPHPYLVELGLVDEREMVRWGLDLANDLSRYLDRDGDLSGLIDGETCDGDGNRLDLSADLLVIDTSALPEGSAALALVMSIMASYLAAVWSRTPRQRTLVLEEGYHVQGAVMEQVGAIFHSLAKRGRGIGLSVVLVVHHLADIPAGSPIRTLIQESGIFHVFRQDRTNDAADILGLLNWPGYLLEDLMHLEDGVHLQQIGSEAPFEITAYRSRLETWITNTDEAMHGQVIEDLDQIPDLDGDAPLVDDGQPSAGHGDGAGVGVGVGATGREG